MLAKVVGDPLQEIAVVYWPLLESDATGVSPVTGAVIVTLAVEIVVAVTGKVLVKEPALIKLAVVGAPELMVNKPAATPVNV